MPETKPATPPEAVSDVEVPAVPPTPKHQRKQREPSEPQTTQNTFNMNPVGNGKDSWVKLIAALTPQALIQVLLVGMVVWMGTVFLDKVNGLHTAVADLGKEVRELRLELARTHK